MTEAEAKEILERLPRVHQCSDRQLMLGLKAMAVLGMLIEHKDGTYEFVDKEEHPVEYDTQRDARGHYEWEEDEDGKWWKVYDDDDPTLDGPFHNPSPLDKFTEEPKERD